MAALIVLSADVVVKIIVSARLELGASVELLGSLGIAIDPTPLVGELLTLLRDWAALLEANLTSVAAGALSALGPIILAIGTGLILSVVSGYSDSSNAPVVALILLALNLALKPEGIFGHNSARSV